MHAATIRLDKRLLAHLLGFEHGEVINVQFEGNPRTVLVTIEHHELPDVPLGQLPPVGYVEVTETQRTFKFIPD